MPSDFDLGLAGFEIALPKSSEGQSQDQIEYTNLIAEIIRTAVPGMWSHTTWLSRNARVILSNSETHIGVRPLQGGGLSLWAAIRSDCKDYEKAAKVRKTLWPRVLSVVEANKERLR